MNFSFYQVSLLSTPKNQEQDFSFDFFQIIQKLWPSLDK